MNKLNNNFFEKYKHLDKLCKDIYQDQYGVSRYIDDMKNVSSSDYKYVLNWEKDLKQLIHLRHIRNYLAHTEGAFNEEICTQEDIDWSKNFCKRILEQSDPLAVLYQCSKEKQQLVKTKNVDYQTSQQSWKYKKAGRYNIRKIYLYYWIIFIIIIIGSMLLFMKMV